MGPHHHHHPEHLFQCAQGSNREIGRASRCESVDFESHNWRGEREREREERERERERGERERGGHREKCTSDRRRGRNQS